MSNIFLQRIPRGMHLVAFGVKTLGVWREEEKSWRVLSSFIQLYNRRVLGRWKDQFRTKN